MVEIERLPASSDSDSDSESDSSSDNGGSDSDGSMDEERARILRRVEMKPDSDDSESEEEEEEEPQAKTKKSRKFSKTDFSSDEDGSSSDDDSDDDDNDDDDNENDNWRKTPKDDDNQSSDDDEEDSSSSDDDAASSSDNDNQHLSLQERISRQEEKQSTQRTIYSLKQLRERRTKASSIAKERLQKLRDEKASNNNEDAATSLKKKSKHAPAEVSSRRRHNKTLNESGIGVEIGSNRYQPRDPRMSNLTGHFNADQHEHHFGFLEQVQQDEIATLKRKLKAHSITGKRGQRERKKLGMTVDDTPAALQHQLEQLQQSLARQNQQKLERKAKQAVKQKLQQRVQEGKGGVYFPKRSELKKMQMEAKVEEIQKTKGTLGLNKYLAKRRKKQKSQHAKKMRTSGGMG